MFSVVVEQRKRRVWSARTVAISIGAHLLVLAAVVAAAANAEPAPKPTVFIDIGSVPDRPPPPRATPTPPAPEAARPQVRGNFVVLQSPTTVPVTLPPPDLSATPLTSVDVSGLGIGGDVIGTPAATPTPPTGSTQPLRDWRTDDDVIDGPVDQMPQLLSPRDAQRTLERVYPPNLRDAGVTGHTTVQLVIDRTGAVRPGSVTVEETTHDAFRDAAVRAAEHFRFRPAKLNGQAVSVLLSIPIEWTIQP